MKKTLTITLGFWQFILAIPLLCSGQKLVNVQKAGLRAPDNVKIDGRAIEWGNNFAAYNHATEIFYTLANNDNNLYFTVRTTDIDILNRVVGGGVSLFIQRSGKKEDKNSAQVTYPVTDWKNRISFNFRKTLSSPVDTAAQVIDSLVNAYNKVLQQKIKYVLAIGLPGVDTITSIYNQHGIYAAGLIDNKRQYTFEIAVPLKLLGLSVTETNKFSYHVIVNGSRSFGMRTLPPNATEEGIKLTEKWNSYVGRLTAPTDFWGEYTLAK